MEPSWAYQPAGKLLCLVFLITSLLPLILGSSHNLPWESLIFWWKRLLSLHHPSSQTMQVSRFHYAFLNKYLGLSSLLDLTFQRWRECFIYLHSPHCTRTAWAVSPIVHGGCTGACVPPQLWSLPSCPCSSRVTYCFFFNGLHHWKLT